MIPVLPAIALGAAVLVADNVPTLNVTPSCRASADGILGVKEDIETCIRTENEARNQAAQLWSQFPPADRTSCTNLTTMGGTYTELLTCLEMKRDARRLPASDLGTVGLGGAQPQLSPGMR
jgi:hypothetical protein